MEYDRTEGFEKGWRAALGWVMTHKQEYEGVTPNECWEYIDLYPIIQELERICQKKKRKTQD